MAGGLRLLMAFGLFLSSVCLAWANDTEHRDYVIFVDGKEVGQSRLTLVQQDDGATYVSGTARVTFKQLIINFTYSVESQEWWKDGKLIGLKTQAVENGKKTEVVASVAGEQLHLNVNGQERLVRPEVWTSSYWKLADARFHNQAVPILDVDTGKEFNAQLQYIATEPLKVNGQAQDCFRFRVTGTPNPVELWFDRHHRLVRQEFTEAGHRTIVQLIGVRR